MNPNPSSAAKFLEYGYLICAALFVLLLAYHHVQLINYPLPLSYTEAAIPTVTDYIAKGHNPFGLEAQPERTSVYPVFYNILAAPLTTVFDNTLVMHRAFGGLFLLGCCAFVFRVTKKVSGSTSESLMATALVYAGLLFHSTPVASPNGIGLFLFLATIYIPFLDNFSRRSLLVALIFGVLAFHTKQYFVASLGYVALYLLLAESKSRGIIFGILASVLFVASLALILPGSPYYLDSLIFSVGEASKLVSSYKYVWVQLKEYSTALAPVVLIATLSFAHWVVRLFQSSNGDSNGGKPAMHWGVNVTPIAAPLMRTRPSYILMCLMCSMAIFVFVIGKNPGNHVTYLLQIVSPFLITLVFVHLAQAGRMRWVYRLLILFACYNSYALLSHDHSVKQEQNWNKIRKELASAQSVYSTSMFLDEIMRNGGEIYNNGHTTYFSVAQNKPAFLKRSKTSEGVEALWRNHVERIHLGISQQKFDLVVLDTWTRLPNTPSGSDPMVDGMALLKKHYTKRQGLAVRLADRPGGGDFTVHIWEPRRKP